MVNLRDSNGKSLYFSNRKEYYRRKSLAGLYIPSRFSKQYQSTKTFTRYSVVYMDVKANYTGQSVRAEVVNPEKRSGIIDTLKEKLEAFLMDERAKGKLKGKFLVKTGFEKEEIDSVEASNYELNKITIEWS